jgi:methyl coenzyme M reductase subunit C-like uncharacterized protein (methanogenesis marker protein 7)
MLEDEIRERYEGKLWHEEMVAGRLDVRFQRSEEDLKALNELKGEIQDVVAQIRKEFEEASKPGDSSDGQD